jgi:hypothetical protein
MVVFSSPQAAIREGFRILEYDAEYRLYIVEKDLPRKPLRAKMCAFARPEKEITILLEPSKA